jgi:hypothetical protein
LATSGLELLPLELRDEPLALGPATTALGTNELLELCLRIFGHTYTLPTELKRGGRHHTLCRAPLYFSLYYYFKRIRKIIEGYKGTRVKRKGK